MTSSHQENDPALAALGKEFVFHIGEVNETTLHYVRGGEGATVVLIHGFPQDWFEYHAIMPRLARRFTVVAVDLRGVGGSAATPCGYDAANMAQDICELISQLKLEPVYLVGHDIGGMVTYAFMRRFPKATRGAMILDAPIPGIEGWNDAMTGPAVWHVGFMQVPGLAEKLVADRTVDYLDYFFRFGKFSPSEREHYVKEAYGKCLSSTPCLKFIAPFRPMRNSMPHNADAMTCRYSLGRGIIRHSQSLFQSLPTDTATRRGRIAGYQTRKDKI